MGKAMTGTSAKSTRSKPGKKLKDPFAFFKEATAASFRFLEDEYDFEQVSTKVHVPECEIKYLNETTGVTVTYEWGGVIWLDVSRVMRTMAEVVEEDTYTIDVLLLERAPTTDISEFYPSENEPPNQYVERVLNSYAQILKRHGSDVLSGDFRIFPKLKKHARDVLRQRNKVLFGSEKGLPNCKSPHFRSTHK